MQALIQPLYRFFNRFGLRPKTSAIFGILAVLLVASIPAFVSAADPVNPTLVDNLTLWIANLLVTLVEILGKAVLVVTDLSISTMQYNGFADSAVISAGWAVVRNVVNMFFIVLLLIVAVMTIFGGSVGSWSVNWQQDILKIVGMAVLINFSKTICIIMIDISQVFMLTFANAIRDVAGGNFIQLFGLSDMLTLNRAAAEQKATDGLGGVQAVDMLAGSVLALVLMSIVLGTMVMLLVILIYRIILLWILVVLAPLVFFMKAIPGSTLAAAGGKGAYGEWWGMFIGAATSGPVLVFFVWLALSVASSGNIAATESFLVPATNDSLGNIGGFITEIAQSGRLMSFAIGIGMMFVGFQASQKVAGSAPLIGNVLNKGVKGALGITAGGVGAGISAGLFAGRQGIRAGGYTARKAGQTQRGRRVLKGTYAGLSKVGSAVANNSVGRKLTLGASGIIGRKMIQAGSSLQDAQRQGGSERVNSYKEKIDNLNKDELQSHLSSDAIGPDGVAQQNAVRLRMLTDETIRKDLKDHEVRKIMKDLKDNGGDDLLLGDPDGMGKKMKEFKEKRPDLMDAADREKFLGAMENPDDLLKFDDDAYRNPEIRKALEDRQVLDPATKEWVSMMSLVKKGQKGNKKVRDAISKGESNETVDTKEISREGANSLTRDLQTQATLTGLVNAGKTSDNPLGKISGLAKSGNLNVTDLDSNLFTDPDFVAALLAAIPKEQVAELANNSEAEYITMQLNEMLADPNSYTTGVDAVDEGRRNAMQELVAHMAIKSRGTKAFDTLDTVGYENGKFQQDGQKEAFSVVINNDPSVLINENIINEIKAGGEMADAAFESVDPRKLVNAQKAAGFSDEGLAYADVIEAFQKQAKAKLGSDVDDEQSDSLYGEIAKIKIELKAKAEERDNTSDQYNRKVAEEELREIRGRLASTQADKEKMIKTLRSLQKKTG